MSHVPPSIAHQIENAFSRDQLRETLEDLVRVGALRIERQLDEGIDRYRPVMTGRRLRTRAMSNRARLLAGIKLLKAQDRLPQ